MDLYQDFKVILNTGKKVLLLKADAACDCVSEGILAGEPDAHCPICKGTGFTRTKIITEKIRSGFLDVKKDTGLENQTFEKIKNEILVFYFPFNYDHINAKDIIVTLKHNASNEIVKPFTNLVYYKVINIKEAIVDDFKFIKIIGEKFQYM